MSLARFITLLAVLFVAPTALIAQLPPPPAEQTFADWSFPWADDVPGVLSCYDLLDKPAGRNGPVVARDGHFFTGEKRIRFVGVNVCFAAAFPPKEKADAIARRLASFGVNCVRFHHLDMFQFPNGIFADAGQPIEPSGRQGWHGHVLMSVDGANGRSHRSLVRHGHEYMSVPPNVPASRGRQGGPYVTRHETGAASALADADRILISALARQSSAGMEWNAARTTVSDKWGKAPAKVEVVKAEIELDSARPVEVWALGPDGKRTKPIAVKHENGRATFMIGSEPTVWYEVVRK